jgi:hypothetical protein
MSRRRCRRFTVRHFPAGYSSFVTALSFGSVTFAASASYFGSR